SATILSPYFQSFDLMFGVGLNPDSWQTILSDQRNQIYNQTIANIDLPIQTDTVFTLRIVLYQTNGLTKEERINFNRITKQPKGELISIFPAYYGDKPTFTAALYTDVPAIAKMYYRKANSGENYRFVSLDGFATNNFFVKQLHYGFIPKGIVEPNTDYEIYFEIENQLGNSTKLMDNGNPFIQKSLDFFHLQSFQEKSYTLPPGSLFESTFELDSSKTKYLFLRENNDPMHTFLYKFENDGFTKIVTDTLSERIPKAVGDFNRNGKLDVLALWSRHGFIMEQREKNSIKFDEKQAFDKSTFWPIFAQDVDGDSVYEVGALTDDSTISVYKVNNDLSLTLWQSLKNFSPTFIYANEINFPHCVIADLNKNGKSELWFLDREGDIFSYELNSIGKFVQYLSASTGFESSSNQIATGDFDNDGTNELAVLVHSIAEIDIASFNILEVLKLDYSIANNPKLNITFSNAFVDPAEEFGSSFQRRQSALKFMNIDNQQRLVLFTFPYSYILSNNSNTSSTDFIYFDETTNSNSIFNGNLSSQTSNEVAFPKADKIVFLSSHFSPQYLPTDLAGYSIDSSSVYLKWNSNGSSSIYRGDSPDTTKFVKIGTANATYFTDYSVMLNQSYYYAIKDISSLQKSYSTVLEVYHHKTAAPVDAKIVSPVSIELRFDEKIKTVVENIESFRLLTANGILAPHSVSASSRYYYFISFTKEMSVGENKLLVSDLSDFYNSPIETDTLSVNYIPEVRVDNFFITSHSILSPYKISIQFNLRVDTASVLNKTNYEVIPANPISSVYLNDNKTVIINFINRIGAIGTEYKLMCKNILSDKSDGSLVIETGAGSEVILVEKAVNLDNVFVYPSPAKITNSWVTFANLPQYAEILIYTLSGSKINDIFESDGNGGLTWDLRDLHGNQVNTGVYLYFIKQLDSNKNEIGQKVGKLAVIK
ncbi:MAG: hypothetical protein Q8N83_17770, partial [Ignavibacteria bacterium]|nr:hypothetical protein [Ignavibacteria bacterium]